jgi:hypothetical protein
VGGWSTTTVPLGIPYANEIKIIGVTFSSTIEQSTKKSWAIVTNRVRAQARDTYARDMPFSAVSVCARIPPSQNLVHVPDVPGAHGVYPTFEYSRCMVHMEGSNFPSTIINITHITRTLCQLPNTVATPVTNRLYRLQTPCKMEIVPGDQQNAAGGELPSIL